MSWCSENKINKLLINIKNRDKLETSSWELFEWYSAIHTNTILWDEIPRQVKLDWGFEKHNDIGVIVKKRGIKKINWMIIM